MNVPITSPTKTTFRPATGYDGPTIARLMQIASDGVCDYIWSQQQAEFPGLTPLEIGARRYAEADASFSYRNCILAVENDMQQPIRTSDRGAPSLANGLTQGLMLSFGVPPATVDLSSSDESSETSATEPDVLSPYALEQPDSWYICALAVFPRYRGQGIGRQFLDIAAEQAIRHGYSTLSLLCFEQNVGALRLYRRYGFRPVDRTQVVPHPLIHYTGDILLMTKLI